MLDSILLLTILLAAPPAVQDADRAPDPEATARSAAFRYESLLRRRAPERFGGTGSGPCHEIIGRFCFRFGDDGPDEPPEPEHPDITRARRGAARAFRAWLALDPGNPEAAGGVVRYLVEDRRPREAVSLARAHVAASPSVSGFLLLGFALHYSGEFDASEAVFDTARAMAGPEERDRLDDVALLLEPGERRRYGRLEPAARRAYHDRLWAFSDPSLRVPGNERRSGHYARHAWIRILSEAPRTAGMVSWGGDHEEIVLRYGVPWSRERVRQPAWRLHTDLSMIETFDPRAVALVPPALLTEGLPGPPVPGSPSYLGRDTVRSSYAPVGLERLRGLELQATRVPTETGWRLRVDATLAPDTAGTDGSPDSLPRSPAGLLVVLDTMGRELSRSPAELETTVDGSLIARASSPAPAGPSAYQMEIGDDSAGYGGVGRYRLDVPSSPLRVGDPVLAPVPEDRPAGLADLTPFPALVLQPGGAVYVWTEVRGLLRSAGEARYGVEWWLEPRTGESVVGRVVGWVGRVLGLSDTGPPVRVAWEASSEDAEPVDIGFTVDLAGVDPGLHRLGLTIRDRVSGREATVYRTFRLDPRARDWSARGLQPIPDRR
ncbi:MAG: hypothetical protein ACOC5I_00875 [Gemmatimonadota bacterium]